MKYVNPNDCAKWGGSIYQKVEPTLRYADILLMYAEALNNISEGHTTRWPHGTEARLTTSSVTKNRCAVELSLSVCVPESPTIAMKYMKTRKIL